MDDAPKPLKRALIVDDEPMSRDILARFYEMANIDAVVAGSAAEALAELESERFDLVLTDIDMPGTTGIELATALRALHPDLPVYAFTGRILSVEERRLFRAVYQKPGNLSQMVAETLHRTALGDI